MRSFKGVGRLCTLTLLLVATALSSCGAEECEPGESKELICADETYILRCRSDGTWRVASCNDLRIEQDAIAKKPADLDYDPKNSLAVLDKTTGLIWQRIVELKRRTKADGVSYCEGLEVKDPIRGQLSDWRLPSRDELETIVLTTRPSQTRPRTRSGRPPRAMTNRATAWTSRTLAPATHSSTRSSTSAACNSTNRIHLAGFR